MADATTVVEGNIKFREGKKWKPRWCVLKKPSPVADQLQVILYKNVSEVVKNEGKPKSSFALDGFFGLDAGFAYDREQNVLAIICQKNVSLMAFEHRENMIKFEIGIRQGLGEEHQFKVRVAKAPSNSRLPKEQICLMIHDTRFCVVAQSPPKVLLSWNVEDLRRFGARDGKFCFEGGSRCGKGSGVFALQSDQAEDIADIVKLASTGKMSNCHRKFKNRNSQIDFSSHIIADMSSSPSSSSIHHTHHNSAVRAPPLGPLPTTLNCCYESQTGSAESEDWSWYKRHSVSVMDHRRIAALRERGFLDNREQFVIYDVPPNHGRKLENTAEEEFDKSPYACPRPDPEIVAALSSSNTSNRSTPVTSSTTLSSCDYGNYKKIEPRQKTGDSEATGDQKQAMLRKRQSASAEFFDNKVSNLEEMIAGKGQNDLNVKNSHEESLQRLKKQESDLQREMVLLDEMLQHCTSHSEEPPSGLHCISIDSADRQLQLLTPEKRSEPSLLASLNKDFTILSGNVSPMKVSRQGWTQSTPVKKIDRTTALRLNTSMPEGTPVSPQFHAKLKNIPPTSRLNAPLPYVNLSKYDDESNSHVHLPGSADCVPVARGSSMQGLDGASKHLGLRGHSHSLTSLHVPASASNFSSASPTGKELNVNRDAVYDQRLLQPSSHASLSTARDSNQCQSVDAHGQSQEILVVKMEDQSGLQERGLRPTVRPSARNDYRTGGKANSDIVSILTTDAGKPIREEKHTKRDEIYENLPVSVERDHTPPPALPPKGPALLKRLKAAAAASSNKMSCPQEVNQITRSASPYSSQGSQGRNNYGYDNHPRRAPIEREQPRKADTKEDNYLIMGSPKIKHKLPTVSESTSKTHINLETVVNASANHKRNPVFGKGDYMDMATHGPDGLDSVNDDEIYLDIDEDQVFSQRDLYISEADLKLSSPARSNTVQEGTYMEMASISGKKTTVMQNLETLHTYVTKTPGGKNAANQPVTSPVPATSPLRPTSLKVRHNSDSGIFPSPTANDLNVDNKAQASVTKPAKSPTKVYTKVKKTNQQSSEPPMPFPNLIDFTKKMSDSRSTYVNTYIDADKNLVPQETYVSRDVPLPEPVKEGFLARFKRRSSKEKNTSPAQDKSNSNKNRNSVLERSMSEHESNKEEKSSRLKLGRRRSSSFPNRLSYQESVDNVTSTSTMKSTASSATSVSSLTSRLQNVLKHNEQSESSSSIHDFSDDSDMSPLLKRSDHRMDPRALTVLHVQRTDQISINPYMRIYQSPVKTKQVAADSSKTDDEKLYEMIQRKEQPRKTVIYQRSSSLELKKQTQDPEPIYCSKLLLSPLKKERRSSFEKLSTYSLSPNSPPYKSDIPYYQECAQPPSNTQYACIDVSRSSSVSSSAHSLDSGEEIPPSLPPKTRPYQGLLSPVIESLPPLPVVSEPLYVELDEIVPVNKEQNIKKQDEEYVQARLSETSKEQCTTPADKDIEKAGRASLSSNGENVSEMNCTLLTIPVDITVEEEIDIECRDVLSAPFSFCQSTIDISENGECTSPAKSVLRPRSGQEYVVIQRSSIPVISDSAILSSLSPYLKKEFDFDPHQPKETVCHHQHRHHHHHLHHHHHHAVPSGRLHSPSPCSPHITPQPSPSLASTADTSKSFISLHCEPWERSTHRSSRHGHDGKLNMKSVTATSSPASSPRSAVSHRPLTSVSLSRENGHKSAQLNRTDDTIFFPKHMLFNGSTLLSPVSLNAQPLPSPSPHIHYPIYVNQEFVDKYHNELSSSQTVNSSGNLSSASPRRVGACPPLMSVLLKESPGRHSSNSESHISIATPGKSRTRNRHSESDAHKVDKHLLSLPTAVSSQSMCMPINVHRSHSDPKRDSRGASPQLSMAQEDLPQKAHSKIHGKEYDKFAKSAIISRRRLQCEKQADCSEDITNSGTYIYSATDTTVEESGMYLQIPGLKSSGYRNIDSINAAAVAAAAATPSPKGVSSGPDASHFGQMSQLENISESQYSPPLSRRSNSPAVQIAVPRPTSHVLTGHKINDNVLSLPHSSSPPPPLPIRKRHSSSPPSTPSVNSSVLTPSDISDSPPPYFAPSPPSSPPPPAVPPRKPLLPPSPSPVPPSTPSEPDLTSELSDEEQELNYIEIDMTKSSGEAPRPPPVTYSRRSKRIRQQKDKDYAKLRYAEIDLTATKALQQTRQERVQGRSDSMRLSKLKDGARRSGSNLSRINSAPPSSKRKQLSFVPRERKLSSGSVESC